MCAHRNQRRKYEDAPYVVHCDQWRGLLRNMPTTLT
jgi:hypothetical protein